MSLPPVTPEEAASQVRRKYDRSAGNWAALMALSESRSPVKLAASVDSNVAEMPFPPEFAPVVVSLHPPTERRALADQAAAIAWTRSWKEFAQAPGAVSWGVRRWSNIGAQSVPERLVLTDPADIARVAGRTMHWRALTTRFALLLASVPGETERLSAALPGAARAVAALTPTDFDRLLGVLNWLAHNPESNLYIRQLPIHGVDTKWVGDHRGVVQRLHYAASGRSDLGLAAKPDLVRVRFLDPALAPGGLMDTSAPLEQLAALRIVPRTVFIMENLETVLALPLISDAVAVHGSGYAVDRMERLPWVRDTEVIYWGDLDSHGFAILNRLRSRGISAQSVLMDTATLDAHADLCVVEPTPRAGGLNYLTANELKTAGLLAERGNVRLEQERVDWSYALAALERARH